MNYSQRQAIEFAHFIKGLGFRVYLAKSETYGFITDDSGARVLSFSFTNSGSLSGNYGPPSKSSGTGWRLDTTPDQLKTAADVRKALDEHPPQWCGHGWKQFTNVKEHLATFGESSQYKEL